MKKIVQFVLLVTFMMLPNLMGHLIGISFVEGYDKYFWGHLNFFDSLLFISVYSVFQIFVFPINKKYREYIIPTCTLILCSFMLYNDTFGHGFEAIDVLVSLTSKIVVLFTFITDNIIDDTTRRVFVNLLYSLGYSIYLLIIFSSFKYILRYLTCFCVKKDIKTLLRKEE